jgi:hypothetical protein
MMASDEPLAPGADGMSPNSGSANTMTSDIPLLTENSTSDSQSDSVYRPLSWLEGIEYAGNNTEASMRFC